MSDSDLSAATVPVVAEAEWHKLSSRKLLIDPLKALRGAVVPLGFALFGLGNADRNLLFFAPLGVLLVLAAGTVPYLTTRYRTTATQFELRKGLLSRSTATAPLDRVRSIDLEATLLHRLLGVTKVQIGTGVDDDRLVLDSLDVPRAEALRQQLFARRDAVRAAEHLPTAPVVRQPHGSHPDASQPDGSQPGDAGAPVGPPTPQLPPAPEEVLATFRPAWARFAPFNLARLVVMGAALGFLGQFADDLPFLNREHAEGAVHWVAQFALLLVVGVALVGALVLWTVTAVTGYLTQWWGFRLTRQDGSLHLSHGLFTTRSVQVEEQRVRGVALEESLLMRLVRGADLSTLATGTGTGTTQVVPPCPRPVAVEVGARVLGTGEPLVRPLVPHGARATRRSLLRGLWPAWLLVAVAGILQLGLPGSFGRWLEENVEATWFLLAAGVAAVLGLLAGWAASRHLGHLLTSDHVTAGHGIGTRRRTVLETGGIIGWVLRESFFQRRAGLATLVATTAAGDERVTLRDIPRDLALRVALGATPEVWAPFLSQTATSAGGRRRVGGWGSGLGL